METILDRFEKTVKNRGGHIAVEDNIGSLSWDMLMNLARSAGTVVASHTAEKKPVVIAVEKSREALAAMLGVVYADCFYVFVDPAQPLKRMEDILRVLSPEMIIADEKSSLLPAFEPEKERLVLLDELFKAEPDDELLKNRRAGMTDSDKLYGIFTSGSTGTPKCITVNQRCVLDFIGHFVDTFGFTSEDSMGNQAPFDFDVSVKDIYTCMMTGARLVIIPKELFSTPPLLLDYICDKGVTVLVWAVSALTLVAALKGLRYRVPVNVRKILFSGEVMPAKQLRLWQDALPDTEFVNLYGPTEITCNCTYYRIPGKVEEGAKLPIGKPFEGRKVFLLDDDERVVEKVNETAQICVAGESVSDGYLNNPEETKKHFSLFSENGAEPERIYKTGDMGYWGEDGLLYFAGRKDFQIKHMGHRIELEEVERAMELVDGVERGICLMDEKKNRLVAFYVGSALPAQVREQMKERVPGYMIPHKLIQTESMPLNKNGKTDRSYFRQQLG